MYTTLHPKHRNILITPMEPVFKTFSGMLEIKGRFDEQLSGNSFFATLPFKYVQMTVSFLGVNRCCTAAFPNLVTSRWFDWQLPSSLTKMGVADGGCSTATD